MSSEKENRIKVAALELSKALTEHGGEFQVGVEAIDVTNLESVDRQYAHVVRVRLVADKVIAP